MLGLVLPFWVGRLMALLWLAVMTSLPDGVNPGVFTSQASPRIVETQYGRLRGTVVTLANRHLPQVEAFMGLQYASILQGGLRFMPPTSTMDKWDDIRFKLEPPPVCPQRIPDLEQLKKTLPLGRVKHFERLRPFLKEQKEECLYLNVYVPAGGKKNNVIIISHFM